ncbi:Dcp1-like decapping family-domain-containing protein [Multifurca ochricompacta]|uniref:Dcp1-like decapping family-domain-containing protein n=1 Tax=Multifurca ochricompacta TaxID=376703 RepID=A0AAD4M8X4_9AGAM|nr:Dcp1-like decapping family-domain-containing protein [Multifurca ochricompacta]
MKPTRKTRLASNGTSKRSKPAPMFPRPQSESSPNHSSPPVSKPQLQDTVTVASRYQKNLKSLRRIDPTIVSIIDQFSHICLYRLHEGKWQKDGFEGASFLFERAAYPPYGLFILNRAGMNDYIHPIHPEDELQAEGEYLMYRSYPEFTAKRLALAKSAPPALTESWTDARRRTPSTNDPLTNWRYLLNEKPDKGRHETVMFWFLGSDSEHHEPLSDTIERLMTFIRKGEPYPYNLDRLPPPAQHPSSTEGKSHDANVSTVAVPKQSNGSQSQTAATNVTSSELDKLFLKLIPTVSPAATPSNGKVTLETLFASASTSTSTSSVPASNVVTASSTMPNKGLALLDSIFASATPPQGPMPAPTPPFPHHVSSEPFPPPPSAPPSTRLAFATVHPPSDLSSSEPESSEPPSPTPRAAAHLIHSPQPTTSQLPQILTQDVISALLGMPPSRTSSVASSHRRYEGDVESSDDLHEADSPVDERLLPNANRSKKHELGDVTPRPPLRGFASSEKVVSAPAPASALPSHHSAPAILTPATPSAASAPSVPPSSGSVVNTVAGATVPIVSAPRVGVSPAPRALVPFHEESSLWPYPRAPLDDRDDIVELDFADTSALSDVDAFERRRQNGKNGAKFSKKDKAREREEIERSWDVPGDGQVVQAGGQTALGKPSQALTRNAMSRPTASPSPLTGGASKPNQPKIGLAQVKPPEMSPASTLSGDNKTTTKSKPVANGLNPKLPVPDTTPTNGALVKSAASSAIVEVMQAHSNGNPPLPTTDRNQFVREVLTLIHTDSSFVDRLWVEYRARA